MKGCLIVCPSCHSCCASSDCWSRGTIGVFANSGGRRGSGVLPNSRRGANRPARATALAYRALGALSSRRRRQSLPRILGQLRATALACSAPRRAFAISRRPWPRVVSDGPFVPWIHPHEQDPGDRAAGLTRRSPVASYRADLARTSGCRSGGSPASSGWPPPRVVHSTMANPSSSSMAR